MPEISQEELDALRAAAAERDQAASQVQEDAPPVPTHRAMLADGTSYDYAGAHPTHVTRDGDDREIPVVAIHPLP